ncbi:hypothetical protein D3H35_18835 [Cohnella faecalis]|uniref:Uncharacterized protein n=1 Tax=Cohnella faecalis TaxID=2315694 RepID=A0A398CPP8_9BACL|nr:hypothetical protein D3H35_18835 [Cohnella faecalis]
MIPLACHAVFKAAPGPSDGGRYQYEFPLHFRFQSSVRFQDKGRHSETTKMSRSRAKGSFRASG